MSVHWTPEGRDGHKNRTVTHSQPYCECGDGRGCSQGSKAPKHESKAMRHSAKRLAARRKGFDGGNGPAGKGGPQRGTSGWKKPGSLKK